MATIENPEVVQTSFGAAASAVLNPYARKTSDDDDASICEVNEVNKVLPVPDARGKMAYAEAASDSFCFGDTSEGIPSKSDLLDFEGEAQQQDQPRTVIGAGLESFKYLYSCGLLIFSVAVIMTALFSGQTLGTDEKNIHPAIAFFLFWFLIFWLAMMEGGQGCLVGLQPIDMDLYAESHPRTTKNTSVAHKGDNMERFIVGRQFLVVLIVFVANLLFSSTSDASVFGMTEVFNDIFLKSGFALILTTIVLGQLTAQVNAANCMLDFINNYFMLYLVTYVSMAIEFSGILHAVYLVQIFFSKITGRPIESNEEPRNLIQNLFFWGRVLMSVTLLGFAFAVTMTALFSGKTIFSDRISPYVAVTLFFVLMVFVGMMEGMQIALFAVVNLPEEELQQHAIAHKNCQLTFTGQNLQAFLIGRQICVTICTFVVASFSTLNYHDDDDNVFGVTDPIQELFNTGLLGALITTIVASLAWRVIASSFPLAFLSNPIVSIIIRLCLLVEASGLCSSSWVLARYHKPLLKYQPDEVYLEDAEPHDGEAVTRRDMDIDRIVTVLKFSYSLALLIFSVIVVMAAMFTEQTVGTGENNIHPALAFFVFWFLIFWLSMLEGGQGALVGLQQLDKDVYRESHPRALKNTELAHKGDNMERFIVGRQFLVVLVVFVSNMMAAAAPDASVLGLPDILNEIFLATGIALILTAIMLGQLTAQVNAANCMLDFINNYFMLYFVTYISLAIEASGLLHSVYLVQIAVSMATGKPIESKEPPRSTLQKVFFWARVLLSLAILGFAFAVTLKALFDGNTTMWDGIPPYVSVIVFFLLMSFVGMMDGMQIALFAVVNLPEEAFQNHKVAYTNCQLTFKGDNLQAFLIGRQICVTICMFVVARVTTLDYGEDDDNIFGVPDGLQAFLNTGLLGAIITTIVASLAWRIIGSSFSLAFLSNPLIYLIIRLCLLLEASGLCSAAWALGRWNKLIVGYQPDGVYLEGAPRHGNEPVSHRDKDIDVTVTVIKYLYSMALLAFCVIVVMTAFFTEQVEFADSVHPLLPFFVFWGLLIWLAMMEGGQGALVGLQSVNKNLYADTHRITHMCTTLAHMGDNMQRFIIGRQFLVVLIIFVLNMCCRPIEGASILGFGDVMMEIFLGSGLAVILATIMIGQLTAQINAANCMLDFINTYFMLFTILVSLFVDYSGILHSVYLVQILFSKISGIRIESNEPPRGPSQNVFFWARVLLSLAILGVAFTVTIKALHDGKTTMWDGVPTYVSLIIFFVLVCFVGMMEGMQIAIFYVANIPVDELKKKSIASANTKLAFSGSNLRAFLIGRQICVTICMFVMARVTTLDYDVDNGETIYDLPKGLQKFLNTGVMGAIITTIVASLAWRIIGTSFPVTFLSNPLVYLILRLLLMLEASGICSAAWLMALIQKQTAGYQADELYGVGFADEFTDDYKSAQGEGEVVQEDEEEEIQKVMSNVEEANEDDPLLDLEVGEDVSGEDQRVQ